MIEIINEINKRLIEIVDDLVNQKKDITNNLNDVQTKIDEKVDEAKTYKESVEESKEQIEILNHEIDDLKNDLQEITEKFGGKDFDAILDAANKEINSKIVTRQKEIAKLSDHINELTSKAKTIKDLLVNLKKDKDSKKTKLDNLTSALEYYETEINKIVDYSIENPTELVYVKEESTPVNIEYNEDIKIDDSPVFDEIESIDRDEEDTFTNEENDFTTDNTFFGLDKSEMDNEVKKTLEETIKIEEPKEEITEYEYNENIFDRNEEPEIENQNESNDYLDNTVKNVFNEEENVDRINFKSLSDTIDAEYANIFGNSEDIALENNEDLFNLETRSNIFDNPDFDLNEGYNDEVGETQTDIFGDSYKEKVSYDHGSSNSEIINNFYTTNKIDINRFDEEDREYLKRIFNPIGFSKILDVFKKNNINPDYIYDNAKIFEMKYNDLDMMINKLLLSGQTTNNIGYIINILPNVNPNDLEEVINGYGNNAGNIDISELIYKAIHLGEYRKSEV